MKNTKDNFKAPPLTTYHYQYGAAVLFLFSAKQKESIFFSICVFANLNSKTS